MSGAAHTKMVNSRVGAASAEAAARVLEKNGLTVSGFIRNSLDFVARMGEVPESGFRPDARRSDADALRSFVRKLETKPMPGKEAFGGYGEDELFERLMMERHGY